MFRIIITVILWSWATADAKAADCSKPLPADYVRGQDLCLGIKIYGDAPPHSIKALVVVIHGDTSGGGATRTQHGIARRVAGNGVVAVGLLRPGYYDSDGRQSEGHDNGRRGFTPGNVDAVADAVRRLKEHYAPRIVILVGHSGGAGIAGIILGRYPALANSAVLVSCPCNMEREEQRGRRWAAGMISPHQFATTLPKSTKVVAITGSGDTNTLPAFAQEYVSLLVRNGVEAQFEAVPGEGHDLTNRFMDVVAAATLQLMR